MSKVKDALCVEYGEFDVSQDRDKYIGGSDLPIICGISKFKTRWQLLLKRQVCKRTLSLAILLLDSDTTSSLLSVTISI